ncbi:MAG: GNAT family N-acetyltransferase [Clostridia bacterium]|nr:GNAT family N-acetyltransferase [Clostridia bacterium]
MVVIRSATLMDLPEVVELAAQMDYKVTPDGIKPVLIHYINNPDYYLLVAEKEGQVIGMVGFTVKYYLHREKPVLYVGSMVVNENYRSQGIGKLLMDEVEAVAIKRGCNSIQLNSNKRRVRAHEFYKRLGFKEVSLKFEKILDV